MKPSIIIRPAADAELDQHTNYIARDSPDAARRFLAAAEEAFQKLAEMPGIGRPWPSADERLAGIRVWPVHGFRSYLVFYTQIEGGIEVLHVFHGARDVERILAEEEDS